MCNILQYVCMYVYICINIYINMCVLYVCYIYVCYIYVYMYMYTVVLIIMGCNLINTCYSPVNM
jgi:hypothetical protein